MKTASALFCKNLFGILLTCLMASSLFSQSNAPQRASYWYFGQNGAGIDFNCKPPKAIRGGMYYSIEGCASISDSLGNLLFYTNGDTVYDKSHQIMPHGFGIGNPPDCWGSSTQGALIVPQPGMDSLYYIFTIDCADDGIPNNARYSIVDRSANGGLGDVVAKYQLLKTPVTEKLAAVHHANGKDIWVVMHEHGTDVFYSYLVTETGLDTVPVVSHAGQVQWLPTSAEGMTRGYMKFSPNGERLVVLSVSDQHVYCLYPELFDFDDATGHITLDYTIVDADSTNYYGATFSPDNNLLYLSGGWFGQYVHQFNANAGDAAAFLASKVAVFTSSDAFPSAMQIGPDGKIYIATARWWIDVVHHPNVYGAGCSYQPKSIGLQNCPIFTQSLHGLPNYPESYFRSTYIGSPCLDTLVAQFVHTDACEGIPCFFTDSTWIVPDTLSYWAWDFGDPASGADNSSFLQNPSHAFSTAGTYEVTLIVSADIATACKMDTLVRTVVVDVCTGVGETVGLAPSLQVHPNPFVGHTTIGLTQISRSDINIFTSTGRRVMHLDSEGQHDLQVDFGTELPAGIYWIIVHTGNAMLAHKLIKLQ